MQSIIQKIIKNEEVSQVENLDLELQKVRQITPKDKAYLEKFEGLKFLSLQFTELISLDNFPSLSNLVRLNLAENKIREGLQNLQGCPDLEMLDLTNNKISKLEDLEPLKQLQQLKILNLEQNKVSSTQGFKKQMWSWFPNLQILNEKDKKGKNVETNYSSDEDSESDDGDDLQDFIASEDESQTQETEKSETQMSSSYSEDLSESSYSSQSQSQSNFTQSEVTSQSSEPSQKISSKKGLKRKFNEQEKQVNQEQKSNQKGLSSKNIEQKSKMRKVETSEKKVKKL